MKQKGFHQISSKLIDKGYQKKWTKIVFMDEQTDRQKLNSDKTLTNLHQTMKGGWGWIYDSKITWKLFSHVAKFIHNLQNE